jgi:uncharacterized repeat protein (TIGR01451 family)
VSNPLPKNTLFKSLEVPAGWRCTTPAIGSIGTVTCTIDTFALTKATFTLTVRIKPGTSEGTVISNTATITSATSDSNAADNMATKVVGIALATDVSVEQTATPAAIGAGGDLTYTISVQNGGPDIALETNLIDELPTHTTFKSLTAPAGWTCTTPAVGTTGTITCQNIELDAGNATFTLVVTISPSTPAGTVLSNAVSVDTTTPETNTSNNMASLAVTVHGGPAIVAQPVDQTILAGRQAALSVTANGMNPITYQWYEGAQGDTSRPVAGATANSFTTPALTTTTTYWVRITDAVGTADSNAATINVVDKLMVYLPSVRR